MTTAGELVHRVVDVLDALNIPFMVVGSFSSNVYGIPRSTKDADFVIQLGNQSIAGIASALGDNFTLDSQLAFDSVTGTTAYRFRHRHSPFMVELFAFGSDPHDQARFQRRVQETIEGRPVFVPTAEDVIVTKLRWNRRKDIDDILGIIGVRGERLDLAYLRKWTDQHGTLTRLEKILSEPDSPVPWSV